ncbi:hypothetical protein ACH5A2_31640 [Streptomyces collinus]|uniref:hypothetical protein n=1 Tax=Streptomyces collinus TaxID=42684 RepID=UPI0037956BA5
MVTPRRHHHRVFGTNVIGQRHRDRCDARQDDEGEAEHGGGSAPGVAARPVACLRKVHDRVARIGHQA